MAVYTEVSDQALIEHMKLYDLGQVLSIKGIAEGVENSNFLLRMEQGTFILTLYEKRVAARDLPFFMGLMEHLATKGFTCPQPIHMKNGDVLGELAGRPAAIVSFLEGMGINWPKPEECRKAGIALAQLHQAASDFEIHRANALCPAGWVPLANANLPRADEVEAGMADLISSEMAFQDQNWATNLPVGVIHGDFFKDNVFFLDGELSGVIDFYFGCNDLLAYDLAIAINAWCFDEDLNFLPDHASAMMAGYQSVRALVVEEKAAFPTLARGAALRFLLTRVHDWLNVPEGALVVPHDPIQFSKRLKFHREHGSLKAYGLA